MTLIRNPTSQTDNNRNENIDGGIRDVRDGERIRNQVINQEVTCSDRQDDGDQVAGVECTLSASSFSILTKKQCSTIEKRIPTAARAMGRIISDIPREVIHDPVTVAPIPWLQGSY